MKIAIGYASMSGNTQIIALQIQKYLATQNIEAKLFDLFETPSADLAEFDLVFWGCSTYDDGQMNPLATIFFETAVANKQVYNQVTSALFSLGDSMYPEFATAGKVMETHLSKMGSKVLEPIFIIDGFPTTETLAQTDDWTQQILDSIPTDLLQKPA